MSKRRKFSNEFKQEAVGLTEEPGVSCSQVARESGIGPLLQDGQRPFPGRGHSKSPFSVGVREIGGEPIPFQVWARKTDRGTPKKSQLKSTGEPVTILAYGRSSLVGSRGGRHLCQLKPKLRVTTAERTGVALIAYPSAISACQMATAVDYFTL